MRIIATILIGVSLLSCSHRPTPKELESFRDELLAMRDRDQEVRRRWIKDRENPALKAEVQAIDAKNIARLNEIIGRVGGWPGTKLVGEKASGAAWTVAQHADAPTMRRLLPLMETARRRSLRDDGRSRSHRGRAEADLRVTVRHKWRQMRAASD